MSKIIIKGAREHNLKNISLEIPRDRLIVISGLSGSGKSSLAFDTIFAEGQRRYVESLSSYARQFLGRLDKPDVDYLEGLSPSISIEQKTVHKNPRSTVGTITEIYDYYRLLFARIGKPFCPKCHVEIKEQSIDQIIDAILSFPEDTRLMILAPIVKGRKGTHQKLLEDAGRSGFARIRINGEIHNLEDTPELDKNKKHNIEIVVDRLKLKEEARKRITESVETSLEVSEGKVIVLEIRENGEKEYFFSEKNSCPECGYSIPELQPRLFSFNSPYGACQECDGLGMSLEFDRNLILPDDSLSFNEGAFQPYNPDAAWNKSRFHSLAQHFGFSLDTPVKDYDKKILDIIFNGSEDNIEFHYENREKTGHFHYSQNFPGITADLERRYRESTSSGVREWLEGFMTRKPCKSCGGLRLREEALNVFIKKENIASLSSYSVKVSHQFFENLKLDTTEMHIAEQILKEIKDRLGFLMSVGLEYLDLSREAATLSGGEAQRIRLATQIGSSLVGVLYILDEPSIGLHQRDNQRLIDTLLHLKNLGNTLIVVEHDEQTLRTADHIIDMGPGAGVNGGRIVAQGNLQDILESEESPTGRFLSGRETISLPKSRRTGTGHDIVLKGAREHNLKNINVRLPLGTLIAITGVSGSGKSTLLTDLLYPALLQATGNRSRLVPGEFDTIEGTDQIDKVICIDQSPIGRTPRSNPATYVNLFTPIRELFAKLPESRMRGFKSGRFSFNVKGGRCESCQGAGTQKIEMHFLPDVYVTCDVCKGKRFNKETLSVRYKGKNIYDVLEMSVDIALEFFESIPAIKKRLSTLQSVGLGYIKLGQSALTLSGGEAQRVKLSLELSKRDTGKTFYIIDEPTTGLHFADVKKLLEVLQALVDRKNTICLIEHNLDVIKQSDYIIDLGPEGGDNGGKVVVQGTPEQVSAHKTSYTGQFLKPILQDAP